MADFGGLGGIRGGRALDPGDLFEAAVARVMGERLRSEGIERGAGFFGGKSLAARLWGSLANAEWQHENGDTASYSFRAAGDLIAAVIGNGDYLDWYCSQEYALNDPEVCELLAREGWRPAEPIPDEPRPKWGEPSKLDA